MLLFIFGIVAGIFIIPIIKETNFWISLFGIKSILKHPLEFVEDILTRTFEGGY